MNDVAKVFNEILGNESLTTQEESRLVHCELVIERGLKTFIEVGSALLEIRDNRLYRKTHPTFEDYCRDKWGWSRRYANMQIAAAQTVKNLLPNDGKKDNGDEVDKELGTIVPIPTTESQVRPLANLEPEEQREAWQDAVESSGGQPTAKDVQNAVDQRINNYRAQGTGENEWYTPAEYIDNARAVMGDIDLDPASNADANETVKAKQYFSEENDGLSQEWEGRIWLNPPYSRELMPAFVQKLISEYESGRVTEAILVSHNNTDTAWFQSLAAKSSAICFPKKRIRFYRGKDVAAPVNGQAFLYLGKNPGNFYTEFSRHGVVVTPYAGELA